MRAYQELIPHIRQRTLLADEDELRGVIDSLLDIAEAGYAQRTATGPILGDFIIATLNVIYGTAP